MTKLKLLIAGYFGSGNIGDEAILSTQITLLSANFDLTVLSINPKDTAVIHNVKSAKLPALKNPFDILKFVQLMQKSNALIIGGGGFLANKLQPHSSYYWLFLISIAKILRKKVVLFAVGCGPFSEGFHSIPIRYILNKVDLLLVRDRTSEYYLKEVLRVDREITVTADTVFLIDTKHEETNNLLVNTLKSISRPLILFVLCPRFQAHELWKDSTCYSRYEGYSKAMANLADFVVDSLGGTPIFLPFFKQDLTFYDDIIRNMKHSERAHTIPHLVNIDALLTLFRHVDLIVGARYHSILFSVVAGTPVLPIVYHHKAYSLVKELQLPYLQIGDAIEWPTTDIDVIKAKDNLVKILQNQAEYKNKISQKKIRLQNLARLNYIRLKDFLEEKHQ